MSDTERTNFDSVLFSRVMLSATVDDKRIHCVHATAADFELVPRLGRSDTWAEELAGQMDVIASKTKSDRCDLLLGDLNTGPLGPGYTAFFGESYQKLVDAGFENLWTTPSCTWCEDNENMSHVPEEFDLPYKGSFWIDHIMQMGCTLEKPTVTRILDQPTNLGMIKGDTRLSDHYGLRLDVEPAPKK